METQSNIHPVFDKILQRSDKEKLLNQKSKVIWLTGLSGAGKTTIGSGLEKVLFQKGFLTQVLDGDNIRSGINNNLKFTKEDRLENIRRVAEVAKLLLHSGVITISCFISPREEIRDLAKSIIGDDDFIEIYVNAPLKICEDRDVKGLYKKARNGEIENFTGITAPFEMPDNRDLEIRTDLLTVQESVEKAVNFILPKITYKG